MELPRDELERMLFFEEARQRAELDHKENPLDPQVRLGEPFARRFKNMILTSTSDSGAHSMGWCFA